MKTAIHSMTFGIKAATAIPEKRFVDYDGNPCGAGEKALAVSHAGGAEAGDICPLALGLPVIEAGGPIGKGVDVESDADGRAIARSAGVVNGTTLDAAAAAGDIIRIKTV